MCGRYTLEAEFSDLQVTFKISRPDLPRHWKPTFNISPSYSAGFEQPIIVRDAEGRRVARLGRWWFIPAFWNKDLRALPTAFNARAEDLRVKSFWRKAFENARCLVPASGWREFVGARGAKQPYHFHLGRRLFAFAGLWSRWHSPEGEVVDSFAIITTEPSQLVARIHDRMPLMLPEASYDAWLDPAVDPWPILEAAHRENLELPFAVYPSDPLANDARYEGADAIRPVTKLAGGEQLPLFSAVTDGSPRRPR